MALEYLGLALNTLKHYERNKDIAHCSLRVAPGNKVVKKWRKQDLHKLLEVIAEKNGPGSKKAAARLRELRGIKEGEATLATADGVEVEEIPEGASTQQAKEIFQRNILRAARQEDLIKGLVTDLKSTDYKQRMAARQFIMAFLHRHAGGGSEEDAPEMDGILASVGVKAEAVGQVRELEEE